MNATASHRGSGYTAAPAEAILRAANLARARRGEERSAQAASLPWRFDADVRVHRACSKRGACAVLQYAFDGLARRTGCCHEHDIVPPPLLRIGGACAAASVPKPGPLRTPCGLLLPFVHSQLLPCGLAVICCTVVWSAVCSYESLIFIVFLFMRRPPLACNPSHSPRPLQAPCSSPQVHLTSQVSL